MRRCIGDEGRLTQLSHRTGAAAGTGTVRVDAAAGLGRGPKVCSAVLKIARQCWVPGGSVCGGARQPVSARRSASTPAPIACSFRFVSWSKDKKLEAASSNEMKTHGGAIGELQAQKAVAHLGNFKVAAAVADGNAIGKAHCARRARRPARTFHDGLGGINV